MPFSSVQEPMQILKYGLSLLDLRFNLPCGSQFNPFVKQPSIIELTEQTRLGDGVGRVTL